MCWRQQSIVSTKILCPPGTGQNDVGLLGQHFAFHSLTTTSHDWHPPGCCNSILSNLCYNSLWRFFGDSQFGEETLFFGNCACGYLYYSSSRNLVCCRTFMLAIGLRCILKFSLGLSYCSPNRSDAWGPCCNRNPSARTRITLILYQSV